MAEKQVIRQDVVQIKFETIDDPLNDLIKSMQEFQKAAKKAAGEMDDGSKKNKTSLKGIADEANKLNSKINKVGSTALNAGKKIATGLGKTAVKGVKTLSKSVLALGTAFGGLVTLSTKNYAEYEQLVGGVETLFGSSKKTVMKYADEAYKTAGLSANAYMETITGFSASLLQSVGGDTAKAAEIGNRAVIDMSDNANKMGTDMESIQNAYQGFAKQNYTMLDNLKLGYGGTKEEMQRLIKEAANMKDVQEKLGVSVDANSMSFSNIINAISVVQENMGIAGATSDEAATTIQGSVNMMKGAWTNFLTGMADPSSNFDQLCDNLINSVITVGRNIIPVIARLAPKLGQGLIVLGKAAWQYIPPVLKSFGAKIVSYAPIVGEKLKSMFLSAKDYLIAHKGEIWEGFKTVLAEGIALIGSMFGESLNVEGIKSKIQSIADTITGIVGPIADFVKRNFDTIIEVIKIAGITIGIFVGIVKTIKIVTSVVNGVSAAFSFLTSPIGLIIVAVVALIAIIVVLVRHWDKVKAAAVKCWDKIKGIFGPAAKWFYSTFIQPVVKFWKGLYNTIKFIVEFVWEVIKAVWSKIAGWVKKHVVDPLIKKFVPIWETVSSKVKEVKTSIVSAFQDAWDKVTETWSGITGFFKGIWEDAVKAVAKPVNKIIDGANWVMEKLGSDKRWDHWEPYARGTNGHPGGNAIVNDGRGAELVQMPNGATFIPKGRNVGIPNAPKGMKVLDAQRTARLMGRSSPTFHYEEGSGGWLDDVFSFFDNAKGLAGKVIDKFVNFGELSGYALDVGKAVVGKAKTVMVDWIKGLFDKFGGKSLEGYDPSSGVEQWRSTVVNALKMEGLHTADNVKRTLYQMQTESGGNPKAINNWDVNARKGTPSKGLMQVIDPTFKSYARTGYNKNIYDPMSNILASVRYAVARYGSLAKAYQGVGYANGVGTVRLPVYSPGSSVPVRSSTSTSTSYSPSFNLTMQGTVDRTTERTIKRWVKEAMDEVFDSISRTSPRMTEV